MHTITRVGTALGAVALGVALSGGFPVATQDQNTSSQPAAGWRGRGGPRPFRGPGGPGGPGGPIGMLGPRVFERLNLTEAQHDRVRAIAEAHREEQRALLERTSAARDALNAAITSPTFDEAAVRTTSAEVAMAEVEMAVLRARMHAELVQTLTADQQAALSQMQTEMRERSQNRRERPGAPGPGR